MFKHTIVFPPESGVETADLFSQGACTESPVSVFVEIQLPRSETMGTDTQKERTRISLL